MQQATIADVREFQEQLEGLNMVCGAEPGMETLALVLLETRIEKACGHLSFCDCPDEHVLSEDDFRDFRRMVEEFEESTSLDTGLLV